MHQPEQRFAIEAVHLLQSGKNGGDLDAELRVGRLDRNHREAGKPSRPKSNFLSQHNQ